MSTATENFTEDWRAWHTARERELAAAHGWLSITRLEWLGTEPTRFPGLPGTWWYSGDTGHVRAEPGDGLDLVGEQTYRLGATAPGELIGWGERRIELAHRGAAYNIRVHDPEAPVLRDFRGVPAYEPDPEWVIEAEFLPFDQPRPVTVGAVVEGLAHVYTSPGEVRFSYGGARHTLTAFNGKHGGLSILFTDETSGVTTYPANRSLPAAPPREGTVILDFNRAVNLPCAFIDLATCPLPPQGNHLGFAVTAGEKIPHERAG
ncbi:DUF1684 domain-containing protein [Sciscionella sediminilitoris]|uniref:DUF1684 domain-containing protein n=1 Tax=Sciscionella sediminilitoris TaxID=1445613 RepID=UPI0004DF31C7|nr:DUF1684 domain-containing protein [Sciscionella sp. SE31]